MNSDVFEQFEPQQPQLSDDQLLAEARCGDGLAFSQLCQRYSSMLRRRIFSIVRHREDTEDVLQETLLSAYKHLPTFRVSAGSRAGS
jgi:RNA polymerase sigma-70 factor (ECF subfamily)